MPADSDAFADELENHLAELTAGQQDAILHFIESLDQLEPALSPERLTSELSAFLEANLQIDKILRPNLSLRLGGVKPPKYSPQSFKDHVRNLVLVAKKEAAKDDQSQSKR